MNGASHHWLNTCKTDKEYNVQNKLWQRNIWENKKSMTDTGKGWGGVRDDIIYVRTFGVGI